MWKYKSRTLISVTGLAVGFTCYMLATLWIRYERTYDSFHKNAKQMYVVYLSWSTGYSRGVPNPLAAYLKETFPEIEDATTLMPPSRATTATDEGAEITLSVIQADTAFLQMFDVKIIEGSRDFLISGSNKIAITQEKARQLYGKENPIGKIIGGNIEICAVVSDMCKRSNYAFDIIMPIPEINPNIAWRTSDGHAIIQLFPNVNLEAFEKKLYEHQTGSDRGNYSKMKITPITKVRYTDPTVERKVEFQHIVIFALSGLLVILCALFNYLTLFVSRFRIRQKELALRMIFGATTRSLFAMLSVEFLLTLLFSVFAGCLLTEWLYEPFLNLSYISMNLSASFREMLLYTIGVILFSLLLFWLLLFLFRRNSLNRSIQRSHNQLLCMMALVIVLCVGWQVYKTSVENPAEVVKSV